MSRWEPDASGRLKQAALELYLERGFDQTTVADIAARAGLTERTFFRHFADKREVLFDASLQQHLIEVLDAQPASVAPFEAVATAFSAVAEVLQGRRPFALRRHSVIDANPTLQERELIKLASMSAAVAESLKRRGVADLPASVSAEAGMGVFRIAFERWIGGPDDCDFPQVIHDSFAELRAVTAG